MNVKTDYLARWRYSKDKSKYKLVYVGNVWKGGRDKLLRLFHDKRNRLTGVDVYSLVLKSDYVQEYIRKIVVEAQKQSKNIVVVCDEKDEKGCPRVYYANYIENLVKRKVIEDGSLIEIIDMVSGFRRVSGKFYRRTKDGVIVYDRFNILWLVKRDDCYVVRLDYGYDVEDVLLDYLVR